ncbi:hypothetical protein [Bacillus mobilis]
MTDQISFYPEMHTDEPVDESVRWYSQGVEDMRAAAMQAASDAPGTPFTPTEAIRDVSLAALTPKVADLHGGEEVPPGSINAAEALLEETADVAELRASCAQSEADYRRVVRWHHAMAVAIVQLGGDLPEGAPGMEEMVADLVKIHGKDAVRAALDSL